MTSYVVTTVRNTAINILRRQKRDAQNITSFTESVEESIIEPDSIIDIIMDREAKRSLREAIDELEPNERLLLEGKYFLGYDDRQLSELLLTIFGVPMDNIDPRLFGNLSLTMMMSYKAIPDTMPFLFPEVADDMVEFQINALLDEMQRAKKEAIR